MVKAMQSKHTQSEVVRVYVYDVCLHVYGKEFLLRHMLDVNMYAGVWVWVWVSVFGMFTLLNGK